MELSQQLVVISFVFVLLIGGLALAQRRGLIRLPTRTRTGMRSLELLDRLVLTPHHGIHCIRAGGRVLLVATYPGGVKWLEQSKAQDQVDGRAACVRGASG
jgi:flagellar biogenesis protein FliO